MTHDQDTQDTIARLAALTSRLHDHLAALDERSSLALANSQQALFTLLVMAADAPHEAEETFQALGGTGGVKRAVLRFYDDVLANPDLAPYFSGVNMVKQRQRVYDMLLALLGQHDYFGRPLGLVHRHLNITPGHFDQLVSHLEAVLMQSGVADEKLKPYLERIRAFKPEIVRESA